jgi:hypothetical protein
MPIFIKATIIAHTIPIMGSAILKAFVILFLGNFPLAMAKLIARFAINERIRSDNSQ